MYQWYKVPIDYDDEANIQPKYADGYGISYFGDRPFKGFSGTVIDGYYIVKIFADGDIQEKLQKQEDIVTLSNNDVADILNNKFNMDYNFERWNSKFKVGSY